MSGIVEDVLIVGIVAWAAAVFVGLPALAVFALGRIAGVW